MNAPHINTNYVKTDVSLHKPSNQTQPPQTLPPNPRITFVTKPASPEPSLILDLPYSRGGSEIQPGLDERVDLTFSVHTACCAGKRVFTGKQDFSPFAEFTAAVGQETDVAAWDYLSQGACFEGMDFDKRGLECE
jgi:hypothetical protein